MTELSCFIVFGGLGLILLFLAFLFYQLEKKEQQNLLFFFGLVFVFLAYLVGIIGLPTIHLGNPLKEIDPGKYSIAAFTRDRDYFYVLMADEKDKKEELKYYMISKFPIIGELPQNPIGAKLVVKEEGDWKFYEIQSR